MNSLVIQSNHNHLLMGRNYNWKNKLSYFIDLTYNPTVIIAPYNETKWVMCSSCLFLIPAGYSYLHQIYWFSGLCLLIFMASINYWKRANLSWERILDRIVAKIKFVVVFTTGVKHVHKIPYLFACYTGVVLSLYFYYMSSYSLYYWWRYHMMFHLVVILTELLVIQSMIESK